MLWAKESLLNRKEMSIKRFFQTNPAQQTEYALEKRSGSHDWLFTGLQGLLNDLETIYESPTKQNITNKIVELTREFQFAVSKVYPLVNKSEDIIIGCNILILLYLRNLWPLCCTQETFQMYKSAGSHAFANLTLRAGGRLDNLIEKELQRSEPEIQKPISDLKFKKCITVAELEFILSPIGRCSSQVNREFFPRVDWVALIDEQEGKRADSSILSILQRGMNRPTEPSPEEEMFFNELCDALIQNVKELRTRIGVHTVQVLTAIEAATTEHMKVSKS